MKMAVLKNSMIIIILAIDVKTEEYRSFLLKKRGVLY